MTIFSFVLPIGAGQCEDRFQSPSRSAGGKPRVLGKMCLCYICTDIITLNHRFIIAFSFTLLKRNNNK